MGISYDSVQVLERAVTEHKITFPMLSDEGSKTIDAYGVRNREADGTRVAGIPHPVTFIIDQKGVIRAKLVRDGYRVRPTSAELIKAAKELSGTPSKPPAK